MHAGRVADQLLQRHQITMTADLPPVLCIRARGHHLRRLGQDSPSPTANSARRQPQLPKSLLSDEVVAVFLLACISSSEWRATDVVMDQPALSQLRNRPTRWSEAAPR
jgi:hypothetical protein